METIMENCDTKFALEIIQGKWCLRIIWELIKDESIRFNELQRRVTGISPIALSNELKRLQKLGIIVRQQYDSVPPQVEYRLTTIGRHLDQALFALGDWGHEVREEHS
ncbi:helix-turn-helix domain-containing protein [Lactiplantibacillus sp. WILCCON 0030]|uniref:Helix-turn-helix domain-containing protein n=1 Tax=Lactiplantibacillus brownii TaxID=3069269 RepID=A0ABU1ACT6_9LACO|nr:helix-turn-helix domain-containing protein [Lactiplantibacillus brownii]MDQ7938227.1 helix-turn-helix domain-containing protein [Lactiplantibacillus brownii]